VGGCDLGGGRGGLVGWINLGCGDRVGGFFWVAVVGKKLGVFVGCGGLGVCCWCFVWFRVWVVGEVLWVLFGGLY